MCEQCDRLAEGNQQSPSGKVVIVAYVQPNGMYTVNSTGKAEEIAPVLFDLVLSYCAANGLDPIEVYDVLNKVDGHALPDPDEVDFDELAHKLTSQEGT